MGKNVSWDGATETVTLSGELLITDADSFQEGDRPGTSGQGTASGLITEEQAKSKALAHAGLSASQVNFIWVKQDWEDGRRVYEVEFYTDDYQEYDYEIDARTGEILSFDYDAEGYNRPEQNLSGSYIGQDKAASIALSYVSGATQANVRSVKLDWDDGRWVYEVEFYTADGMEYDYEIDAVSGAVVQYDHDAEYYKPQQSDNGTLITESKASQIALDRVSGASENNLRIKLDYDDGRPVYEGEIFYNSMEYEFEIDGYTGTVLEWSAESIYD